MVGTGANGKVSTSGKLIFVGNTEFFFPTVWVVFQVFKQGKIRITKGTQSETHEVVKSVCTSDFTHVHLHRGLK
jgi:hypothetical protein